MAIDQNELNLLLDGAQRWFAENNAFDDRVAAFRDGHREQEGAWQAMADMGWLALSLPESADGFEAGAEACFQFIRLLGKHARPEALDVHFMLAPAVARACPDAAEALMSGQMRLGAVDLPGAAGQGTDEAALSGRTGPVLGAGATHYVVFVMADGEAAKAVLLAADADGLRAEPARLIDKRDTVLLNLDHARGVALRQEDTGLRPQALRDLAAAGLVADTAGALEAGFELTLDYLKQRKQFGRPLSQMQAVQHKMAEIFCDVQQMSALTETLGLEIDAAPTGDWPTLPVAKAFVGRRALRGLGQLIQLSGGIGVTEEYKLTHLYRRLHVAATLFGSAETQLKRIQVRETLLAA